MLRRVAPPAGDVLEAGEIRVDRRTRCVTVGRQRVLLPAKEYELLVKLATAPTHVFTKDELLRKSSAVETHALGSRATDDNARRHAGIYALYDWTGGSDPQWLMVGTEAEFYSHDHGTYFPGGPSWTIADLQRAAADPYAIGVPATDLDGDEVTRIADHLEAVTEQEVVDCASNLPANWPVGDVELEALVDFVYGRRTAVAQRLRALIGAV